MFIIGKYLFFQINFSFIVPFLSDKSEIIYTSLARCISTSFVILMKIPCNLLQKQYISGSVEQSIKKLPRIYRKNLTLDKGKIIICHDMLVYMPYLYVLVFSKYAYLLQLVSSVYYCELMKFSRNNFCFDLKTVFSATIKPQISPGRKQLQHYIISNSEGLLDQHFRLDQPFLCL